MVEPSPRSYPLVTSCQCHWKSATSCLVALAISKAHWMTCWVTKFWFNGSFCDLQECGELKDNGRKKPENEHPTLRLEVGRRRGEGGEAGGHGRVPGLLGTNTSLVSCFNFIVIFIIIAIHPTSLLTSGKSSTMSVTALTILSEQGMNESNWIMVNPPLNEPSYLLVLGADEELLDAPGDGLRPPHHLLLGGRDVRTLLVPPGYLGRQHLLVDGGVPVVALEGVGQAVAARRIAVTVEGREGVGEGGRGAGDQWLLKRQAGGGRSPLGRVAGEGGVCTEGVSARVVPRAVGGGAGERGGPCGRGPRRTAGLPVLVHGVRPRAGGLGGPEGGPVTRGEVGGARPLVGGALALGEDRGEGRHLAPEEGGVLGGVVAVRWGEGGPLGSRWLVNTKSTVQLLVQPRKRISMGTQSKFLSKHKSILPTDH